MKLLRNKPPIWGLLAIVGACAACCALPLLATLGIGAGLGATLAAFANNDALLCASIVMGLVALAVFWLRRRRREHACTAQCATDRSCCR